MTFYYGTVGFPRCFFGSIKDSAPAAVEFLPVCLQKNPSLAVFYASTFSLAVSELARIKQTDRADDGTCCRRLP
jgi:hypothetical protein